MTLSRKDRITGCLMGGALGDAVGSFYEGRETVDDFVIPATFHWTDDTQLTIATCQSIIESSMISSESIANHLLRWYRERRIRGIGSSTLKALIELDAGGHWAMSGATGERAAGNGAAMRIAPLAFFLDPEKEPERRTIRDVCRITHRHEEAYVGALAILRTVRYVTDGCRLDQGLFTRLVDTLPDSNVRDRLSIVRDARLTLREYASRFSASGYVVDSVPIAILAAVGATDILDTIEALLKCGGDTDTTASMFGQIFGAAYGPGAIPSEIVQQIDEFTLLNETASKLAHVCIDSSSVP